jgi:hypothetical protein
MHGARPPCAVTLNNHSGGENFVLKNHTSRVFFAYFSHVGVTTPLGIVGVDRDSRRVGNLEMGMRTLTDPTDDLAGRLLPRSVTAAPTSVAPTSARWPGRWRGGLHAAVVATVALSFSAQAAWSEQCKPRHFRAPYFIKTMGRCGFDIATMSFAGEPAEQARCLMRGMDESRNLGPQMAMMPAPLADRVGSEAGLPTREALSTYLSKLDLEWDFAQYLWLPTSRANDNDPTAPLARYFVIHDTSGPNFGHRPFPEEVDNGSSKINSLNKFRCADGWGKAHVVINRSGDMLLNHELEIPWRETKFEQAANFAGALKGLFLHVELIQPRRSSGHGRHNDAQSPDPAFTPAQYDRLALLYVIASVRARHWLIPAYHAALDADIPNGHDDPLNFDPESFAQSIEVVVKRLQPPSAMRAANTQ